MRIRTAHCVAAAITLAALGSPYPPAGASGAVTFGTLTLGGTGPYQHIEPSITAHPASANVLYAMSEIPGRQNKIWRLNVTSWSPLTVSVTDFAVLDVQWTDVDLAAGDDTDTDPATATLYAATADRKVTAYPVDGTGAVTGTATTTNLVNAVGNFLDRQWIAAAPNGKAYANWSGSLTSPREYYAPLTNAGGTVTGELVTDAQNGLNTGPVAVNAAYAFIAYPGPGTIGVARRELASPTGTWTNVVVGTTTGSTYFPQYFPVVGVAGSKVYVTWSDGYDVYFAASNDNGASFSAPQRVGEGTTERTSTVPTLVVAPSGAVAVAYYEGDGDPNTAAPEKGPETSWYVKVAVNTDPLGGGAWDVSAANPNPVHHGSIAVLGDDTCTSDTQMNSNQLADDFEITRTADGHLALAYPTDTPGDPQCDVILTVSIQTGGQLLT